jgi:hypothetical protein
LSLRCQPFPALLAPVSVLAVWTANQVADTGRYVANMAPLINDQASAVSGALGL